jgi:hypothetical protein
MLFVFPDAGKGFIKRIGRFFFFAAKEHGCQKQRYNDSHAFLDNELAIYVAIGGATIS